MFTQFYLFKAELSKHIKVDGLDLDCKSHRITKLLDNIIIL